MASSRENQVYQAALILFVMITIALALTTYVLYRKAEENIQKAITHRDTAKRANDAFAIKDFENQVLMHMVGFKPLTEAQLDAIRPRLSDEFKGYERLYTADMSLFDAGFQEKNYRNLPQYLVDAIRKRNEDVDTLQKSQSDHDAAMQSVVTREENKTKQAEAALATTQSDLLNAKKAFDDERTRIVDDNDKIKKTTETFVANYNKQLATVKGEVVSLTKDVDDRQRTIEDQKDELLKMRDETFEVADGYIVRVLPNGVCWISLGLADGLRRQTSFSVYDQDDNAVSKAVSKGSIEVIKVLDQHLSECKVVAESRQTPILPGDLIFSPTWKAGRRVHFALAGHLDVNDDGRSNRDTVRNLITLNGGIIDAEVHDDGSVTGKLTVGTRYLVVGSAPTGSPGEEAAVAGRALQKYTEMLGMAQTMGVEVIGLDKFLELTGWKGDVKTVPLGSSATSEDFKPRPEVHRDSPAPTFRPRVPSPGGPSAPGGRTPTPSRGSAY